MPRLVKKLACLVLLTLTGQLSWGFSLLGPFEPYQVVTIGYGPDFAADLGGPKNLGEEYRRNTPVMYYSCDANFVDYFGSNGVAAIDQAMAILNAVTNVSSLSSDLSEYPLQSLRENYVAEALFLVDIKTWTLKGMVEQMGLDEPERFTWTLHDRYNLPGSTCPAGMEYIVVKRNYDPVTSALNQYQASSYVNGTLYSYFISEVCQSPPNTLAVTVPTPVDPLDFTFTAVAGLPVTISTTTFLGQYYTGLTRDDVGGLRYLLRTNLVNFESAGPNTLAEVTNPVPQLLFTSNLTLFASQATTNDAPTLLGLYPNLTIINSSNYFVNVLATNVTPFFTNFPWAPAGTFTLAFATNVVPTIQTRFVHTFGNVLVLERVNGQLTLVPLTQIPPGTNTTAITIERDTVGTSADPFGPAGSFVVTTNSTFTTFLTNAVVGNYVILPTNICAVEILAQQLSYVTTATNFLGSVTNNLIIGNTNNPAVTNANTPLVVNFSEITYSTNLAFVTLQANCVPSSAAFFQGVDHIRFVRRDYDSMLGRFYIPITNSYRLMSITNSTLVPQPIQRAVLFPDILMSAQDLFSGPGAPPAGGIFARGIDFNTSFQNPGLFGPGTIEASNVTTFIWNKGGPGFLNTSANAFSLSTAEVGAIPENMLGSFDGSTNAPIVYPDGTSIANLENQLLIAISPGLLPNGKVGVPYGAGGPTFSATGGQPPYSWSLAPTSPGLPPGLFLGSDGTLAGTPTQDGTFDFTIMLTDAGGRTVDRPYFITIMP